MEPVTKRNAEKGGRWRAFWLSFGVYGGVVLILGAFVGGIAVGRWQEVSAVPHSGELVGKDGAAPSYLSKDVNMEQFWKVWDAVKNDYLRTPVKDPTLFYGSIKGLVASLGDPYSSYFDPQEAASFTSQLEGTFDGIGAELGFRDDQLIIVSPLPGTPAAKAGVKAGDAILKIDGEDTAGMVVDIAVMKIRGPKDTSVTLNIARQGNKEPFDVNIRRDKIVVDSVQGKMIDLGGKETSADGGIAYISISEFNQDTTQEFDSVLRGLGLRNPKGIIIDLRGNPGGYLDSAVEISRDWVGDRTVVIQRKADGEETEMKPTLKITAVTLPTVVLVNKWSASASEIVTGALQDYGKATIVGETTFGKGSVQEYLDNFADGSALKLTVAQWLTPKGRMIDKKGLVPDVTVALTDADAAALRDPQLDKAISILTGKPDAQAKSR